MLVFDNIFTPTAVATTMRRQCAFGLSHGLASDATYRDLCTVVHRTHPTRSLLIFTRDTGHHTSGWWKNPDYERCFHLSLSFRDAETGSFASRDKTLTATWLGEFFGDNRHLLWCEPPYSDEGRTADVWHYRLFMAPDWKTPILPRAEVYSRDWTPAHWKSFSDVQHEIETSALSLLEAQS